MHTSNALSPLRGQSPRKPVYLLENVNFLQSEVSHSMWWSKGGLRIFENGRGFRKIFYNKDEMEWLKECFTQFRWEEEGSWEKSRGNMGHIMWMAMCENRKGKVVVLSRMKRGPKNSGTHIFIPEDKIALGWWQMAEAIYEVSRVEVKAPNWVTKQDKKNTSAHYPAITTSQSAIFVDNRYPCYNAELVVCLGRKTCASFAKILQTDSQTLNRVEMMRPEPVFQPEQFKIQNSQKPHITTGMTQYGLGKNDILPSHFSKPLGGNASEAPVSSEGASLKSEPKLG